MGNNLSNYAIIDVTPTLSTAEYASGDALFNRAEIPLAVRGGGGCSELMNITVGSKKASATPMEIILMQSDQSMEAVNDPMNITAAEGLAANFLGWVDIPAGGCLDMGEYNICQPLAGAGAKPHFPMLLQADAGSTSCYFTAIIGGTVTYAASDLLFRFHIKYR